MTEIDDDATGSDGHLRPGDPGLRDAMVTLVDAMVEVAGSNRRLSELSGVSESTVRNYRNGDFPKASITTAVQLDTWAASTVPDDPGPGQPGSLSDSLARWQGRASVAPASIDPPPVAPGDHPMGAPPAPARPARRGLVPLLGVLVVALAAALVVLLVRARDDGSSPSGVSGVRVDRDLVLDADNFCRWRLGTHPVPLVSARPLVMRVDARCNAPAEPDPVKDVGTSVYADPTNDDPAGKVGAIRTGNSFVPECWTRSADVVEDASEEPNRSAIWIRAAQPSGFLPDINTGGGYTEAQLTGLGLPRC